MSHYQRIMANGRDGTGAKNGPVYMAGPRQTQPAAMRGSVPVTGSRTNPTQTRMLGFVANRVGNTDSAQSGGGKGAGAGDKGTEGLEL